MFLHGADANLPEQTTELTRAPPLPSCLGYESELEQKAWKNAKRGRTLVVDGEPDFLREYFPELTLAPWHRVPKMLPDRRMSPEGRFCLSQTTINAVCDKQRFPSIWGSTLASLAKRALHWAAQYPGISRALTLRDEEGAFPRLDLQPKDVVRMNASEQKSAPLLGS